MFHQSPQNTQIPLFTPKPPYITLPQMSDFFDQVSLFGLTESQRVTPVFSPVDDDCDIDPEAREEKKTGTNDTLGPNMVSFAPMCDLSNDTDDTHDTYDTSTSVDGEEDDSKKANFRFRNWKFTINYKNVPNAETVAKEAAEAIDTLLRRGNNSWRWCFQVEKGKTDGVVHIQGFVGNNNAIWRNSVRDILTLNGRRPWLKTCTGNPQKYIIYCQKDDTRVAGPWKKGCDLPVKAAHVTDVKDPLELVAPYPWQDAILKKLAVEPDDRSVLWVRDAQGGAGKTALCKHLVLKHGALMVGGRVQDATYALAQFSESKKPMPKIVIFNFTRSQEQSVSYQAIEAIKDGIFFSGKYESGMVCMNSPHVLCFANFAPETSKLSTDRWHIFNLIKPTDNDILELVADDAGAVTGPLEVVIDTTARIDF